MLPGVWSRPVHQLLKVLHWPQTNTRTVILRTSENVGYVGYVPSKQCSFFFNILKMFKNVNNRMWAHT
jgi:hypothetical protein